MILSRAWIVFVFKLLLFVSCETNSDKAQVEKLNKERFAEKSDRKEAQFLVDALDQSYALLELAHLGEQKISQEDGRVRLEEIIEGQSVVAMRLKTFAEKHDVSIPFSGPEKTKKRIQNLEDKTGKEFKVAWTSQLEELNNELKNKLEEFRDNAGDPLKALLDTTVLLMLKNQRLIHEFNEVSDLNDN